MWIDSPDRISRTLTLIGSLGQVVCLAGLTAVLARLAWLLKPRANDRNRLNSGKQGGQSS
jgi:hypothetical protein